MPLNMYALDESSGTFISALKWSMTNLDHLAKGGTANTYTLLHRQDYVYKQFTVNAIEQMNVDGTYSLMSQKLEELLRVGLNNSDWLVVWPLYLVHDTNDNNVNHHYLGYVMPRLANHSHLHSDFIAQVEKANKVKSMLLSLVRAFRHVHKQDFAIGDVSINNVMVEKDTYQCILIDCDSFVVNIDGTISKPLGQTTGYFYKHMKNMLTIADFQSNDLFGLAAIMFFILCGQEFHLENNGPYAGLNGANIINSRIQDRKFPVHESPDTCQATSNRFKDLPQVIKELFIATFTQHNPPSLDDWGAALATLP